MADASILNVLQQFSAPWISGLWIILPQTYPFAFFHDDVNFVPGPSHFPNSFRLFFCLCWCLSHFSIQNHLWISSSSSFSLPKVVNKDRSEWNRRKGQLPDPPWRPPSWASPVSCRLFTSTQHIFPSAWQDGQPRWSAFIYAMSQDPLVAAKLQNSWMQHLFLSVFMLGLHTKAKVFAFVSRATQKIVVNLICVETQSSFSPPCGKLLSLLYPRIVRRAPFTLLLIVVRTSSLPFKKVSRVPSHSILLKLFGN